ncbi:vWA domain-containing protein [Hyalangium rubrum]|uniref:VWA domain-containing protein n=1 Tax=Hyalangium rubrum TaxID=3103134 RepID=A0ABU5GZL9_9BACT|nr:VWA domain-containing protein [Hyalangium sp. s54d21]MDY7226329.1 VWA domain-containing protein [Hyalangium sp. s54d21]
MKQMAWAMERDTEHGREVHLLVTLEADADAPRAPVAVNLLIDRSASMRGAPLVAAVEAAQALVAQAGPRDYIGLLAFDGMSEQILPVRAMEPDAKAELAERLSSLETGSGTALHEAVDLGAAALRRVLVPGARPKLLLLTDGEPSVGPNAIVDFRQLGSKVAESGVSLHALGLGRHYMPEILEALTGPSGTGFTHADDAEALPTTVASMVTELFGEVASEARIHVLPSGFAELRCRHRYPARVEGDAMSVLLGAVSQACLRRALFSGRLSAAEWNLTVTSSFLENGDTRRPSVPVTRVLPDSPQGRMVRAVSVELDLVAAEGSAWKALSRRDVESAGRALNEAEAALHELVRLSAEEVPARRHLERLADLRLAVERRVAELPALMVRRAKAEGARTAVSQVIRIPINPKKKVEH